MAIDERDVSRWLWELTAVRRDAARQLSADLDDDQETAAMLWRWVDTSVEMIVTELSACLNDSDDSPADEQLVRLVADAVEAVAEIATERRMAGGTLSDSLTLLTCYGVTLLEAVGEEPF